MKTEEVTETKKAVQGRDYLVDLPLIILLWVITFIIVLMLGMLITHMVKTLF